MSLLWPVGSRPPLQVVCHGAPRGASAVPSACRYAPHPPHQPQPSPGDGDQLRPGAHYREQTSGLSAILRDGALAKPVTALEGRGNPVNAGLNSDHRWKRGNRVPTDGDRVQPSQRSTHSEGCKLWL